MKFLNKHRVGIASILFGVVAGATFLAAMLLDADERGAQKSKPQNLEPELAYQLDKAKGLCFAVVRHGKLIAALSLVPYDSCKER